MSHQRKAQNVKLKFSKSFLNSSLNAYISKTNSPIFYFKYETFVKFSYPL